MRQKQSKNECEQERNSELMRCYRQLLYSSKQIRRKEIFSKLVNMPCSRFWVSEFRAAIVLSDMFNGKDISGMRPNSQQMYNEIFRRACKLREQHPDMTYFLLAFHVVNQPAPCFYLTTNSAEAIISRIKRTKRRSLVQCTTSN